MKTLLLDNYDSFTYNLYQYVSEIGPDVDVVRNDEFNRSTFSNYTSVIISPGPGNPYTDRDIGQSREIVDLCIENTIPLLGICLGHQILGVHFGSEVTKSKDPYHGKASTIRLDTNSKLFKDMPKEIEVMRYHSLIVDGIPDNFVGTAQTDDTILMAMEHETLPIFGIQFHPESIGTPFGTSILRNFLSQSNDI